MAYNVMVVDDSKVTRAMIIRTLRLADVDLGEIHEAGDGRAALQVLDKSWIDMVFADLNMPVMSGLQMVEEMGRRGLMATIPVVIISTERSISRMEELKARGVSAYLPKPVTPETIKTVVEDLLGGGRGGDRATGQRAGTGAAPGGTRKEPGGQHGYRR